MALLSGLLWLSLGGGPPGSVQAGQPTGLATVTLPLQACPGFPARFASSATDVAADLPADAPYAATSLQAWGSPEDAILAPADYSCAAHFGSADGGLNILLLGPDDPCYAQPGGCLGGEYAGLNPAMEGIFAVLNPGGAVPNFELACAYFPSAEAVTAAAAASIEAAGNTPPVCLQSLPPGQDVQQLDDNSVAFYQPADDAHPNPTFGVVVAGFSEPNVLGGGTEAMCTLPADEAGLCKSILVAFLTGYGQRYDPAADSGATALDGLPWLAAPTDCSGQPDALLTKGEIAG